MGHAHDQGSTPIIGVLTRLFLTSGFRYLGLVENSNQSRSKIVDELSVLIGVMDAIGRWRKVRYVGLVVWSLLFSSLVSARSNSGISSTGLLLPHCIRDFLPVPKSESLLGVPGYFSFPIPIFYQ